MFTCKVRDQIFIPSRNSVQNGILNREPTWFNGSLTLNPSYSIMSVFKFFKLYKWYYVVQNSHINSQNVTQLTARAQLTIACSKSKIETLGKSEIYSKFSTQLFSCEYCEIFKNTHFEEHLPTAASGHSLVSWHFLKNKTSPKQHKKGLHFSHFPLRNFRFEHKQFSHMYRAVNHLVPDIHWKVT